MVTFFAFLAGFYLGIFLCSLLIVAGRRRSKEEAKDLLLEQPKVRQTACS